MSVEVAVIGANGYVGKHLCRALARNDINMLRLSAGYQQGISLETGLFSDNFSLRQD